MMREQADNKTSRQENKLMNRQVDEIAFGWNNKLLKYSFDEMTSKQNDL